MSKLRSACGDRKWHLGGMKGFHEYMREAGELEEWIGEQMQHATSEDYGHDYEHCQVNVIIIKNYSKQSLMYCPVSFLFGNYHHPQVLT